MKFDPMDLEIRLGVGSLQRLCLMIGVVAFVLWLGLVAKGIHDSRRSTEIMRQAAVGLVASKGAVDVTVYRKAIHFGNEPRLYGCRPTDNGRFEAEYFHPAFNERVRRGVCCLATEPGDQTDCIFAGE
ncbi:MAG: hypothetical protein PHT12_02085 [Patescibacteria group bacterium]|nr:hypothetical protein [Patescibacteria group bacterium]